MACSQVLDTAACSATDAAREKSVLLAPPHSWDSEWGALYRLQLALLPSRLHVEPSQVREGRGHWAAHRMTWELKFQSPSSMAPGNMVK